LLLLCIYLQKETLVALIIALVVGRYRSLVGVDVDEVVAECGI